MKIIDLFAGCGGLSLGFKKENFKSIAYLDWEQSCVDTLIENIPFEHDNPLNIFIRISNGISSILTQLYPNKVCQTISNPKLDLLIALHGHVLCLYFIKGQPFNLSLHKYCNFLTVSNL